MVVDDGEAYGIGLANDAQKIFKAHGIKVTRESVKETDQNPGGAAGFAADIAAGGAAGRDRRRTSSSTHRRRTRPTRRRSSRT